MRNNSYINVQRRRMFLYALLFSAIALVPVNSLAQDWLTAYNNSVSLYNDGDASKALVEAIRCKELYKKQYTEDHNNYRAILRQLAVVSYDLNEFKKGIQYANSEVESWRKTVSVDEVSYIDALDILGVLYSANLNYDSAIIVLEEATKLTVTAVDFDPSEKAIKECHLAEALYGNGKVEQAFLQFKKSLTFLEQSEELPAEYLSFCYTFGKASVSLKEYELGIQYLNLMLEYYPPEYDDNPEVIDALVELGKVETELTEYQVGAEYFDLALSRIADVNSIEYISTVKLLANNYERQGKHSEAEELLKKVEASVEAGSNQAALLIANQATILLNSGDANGAVHLFDSALLVIKSNQPIDKNSLASISYNTAVAYRIMGNKEKALLLYKGAMDNSTESSIIYQKALIGRVRLHISNGDKAAAEKEISKLDLSKKEDWRGTEQGSVLNELAGYHQSIGDYSNASDYYQKALKVVPAQTSTQLYTNIAFNYMSLLQGSGKFSEAEKLLLDIENTLTSSDAGIQFKFLQNTGNLYHAQGNLDEAEKQYAKALELAKSSYGGKSAQVADILLRQATLAKDKGLYEISEPLFKQALGMVGPNGLNAAAVYNNLGILYQQMGRLNDAQDQFNTALDIYKNNKSANPVDYILTEENLATLLSLRGETKKALSLLSETVRLNKSIYGEESPNYAISLHNYASLLQKEKKISEAKPLFIKALAIQRKSFGVNHASYANTLHNLAVLAEDEKDYTLADSLLNKVIEIRANLFDENHPAYTASLFSRAVLKQQMDDFENAKVDFDKVSNLYLNQIVQYFPSLSESEKTAFYKKITPVFNRYKEFLLEYYVNYKKDEEVLGQLYNIQIATKAILLNSVNKTRNRILSSNDEALITNFTEWQLLKKQLANYYTFTKLKLVEEGINIKQLEETVNVKEKELSLASEVFAGEFDKKQVRWQDVQSKLKQDQVGVELIRIDRNSNDQRDSVTYVALAINPTFSTPKLVIFKNGYSLDNKYLYGYTNSIKYKKVDVFSYDVFWKPLETITKGYKTVLLSPDGVFNKVNANSLYNVRSKTYLNQLQNVQYVTSTRDLLTQKISVNVANRALLIANPFYPNSVRLTSGNSQRSYNFGTIAKLPGTKVEASNIGNLMEEKGWEVSLLFEKEAKKKVVTQASPKLLHIAAHGFFLDPSKTKAQTLSNPLFRSGLLLAGAGDENIEIDNGGILTAYEVMNMNLDQTELVVLSACETALGDVQNGEGVYGLQRAFIVAGANTLIMSLWKVDDTATQKLMSAFYGYWLGGIEKHEALQKAQLDIQKEYEFPYYWGAFIMIGI